MKIKLLCLLILPLLSFAQTDFDKLLKAGEIVLNGFTIFKASSFNIKSDSKIISSVCIKNKLSDKITFRLVGKDDQENKIEKEMVVQNNSKECVFNLPKGIYTFEVILVNKEIYKKGEYKFDDDVVITIKKED